MAGGVFYGRTDVTAFMKPSPQSASAANHMRMTAYPAAPACPSLTAAVVSDAGC